jgi:ERCC4-type nuclease
MTIQVDSREKAHAIQKILQEFDRQGVEWFVSKCFIGDYVNTDNFHLAVDRKQNLSELCNNVVQDHKRFASELERAKKYGVHLIVLVEHGKDVTCLDDVIGWVNPRLRVSPMAVSGERLFKILSAMQNNRDKYDVEFMFCTKADTGKRIIEILSEGSDAKTKT